MIIRTNISKRIKEYVNTSIKNHIYTKTNFKCCPICGGKRYIKYGSYKEIQRYRCKECRKTFSNATNLFFSYSKKSLDLWLTFIELTLKKKSLRFSAKKLGISLATAFYWRHKILYGLKLDSIPDKLQGDVHINKTIVLESFKGCRNIKTAKRCNIWIVAAKGDEDSMLVSPTFRDCWNWNVFDEKIYSKIKKGSYIVAYKDRYIELKAKAHNKKVIKDVQSDNRVKFIMANLTEWLAPYKGIATKYLNEYLSLFILFNLDKTFNCINLMSYLSLENKFIKCRNIGL